MKKEITCGKNVTFQIGFGRATFANSRPDETGNHEGHVCFVIFGTLIDATEAVERFLRGRPSNFAFARS